MNLCECVSPFRVKYFQKISFIRNTTQGYFLATLRHILEKKLSYLAEKEIIIFGQRVF